MALRTMGGICALAAAVLIPAQPTLAVERHVPGMYPTIQAAIDACVDGDEVIIAPASYTGAGNRDIDFLGKAIVVRSTDPSDPNVIAATIINCGGTEADPHRGFCFQNGTDTS